MKSLLEENNIKLFQHKTMEQIIFIKWKCVYWQVRWYT